MSIGGDRYSFHFLVSNGWTTSKRNSVGATRGVTRIVLTDRRLTLTMSKIGLRQRILTSHLLGPFASDILFPAYVRLYPFLHLMWGFEFDGRRYRYMFHPYGATIHGERIVEVPILGEELRRQGCRRVLEVGNVMSHYIPCTHTVIDKYERFPGRINLDLLEFFPDTLFDFIFSISTGEHIGLDDCERSPEKSVLALQHMRTLLAPGGRMVGTIPLGYNPVLDGRLFSDGSLFDTLKFMRRISKSNRWVEAEAKTVRTARYGEPYPFANALAIGYLAVGSSAEGRRES